MNYRPKIFSDQTGRTTRKVWLVSPISPRLKLIHYLFKTHFPYKEDLESWLVLQLVISIYYREGTIAGGKALFSTAIDKDSVSITRGKASPSPKARLHFPSSRRNKGKSSMLSVEYKKVHISIFHFILLFQVTFTWFTLTCWNNLYGWKDDKR